MDKATIGPVEKSSRTSSKTRGKIPPPQRRDSANLGKSRDRNHVDLAQKRANHTTEQGKNKAKKDE